MIVKPMLAHMGTQKDLERQDYVFEPKLDGIRALCYVNKDLTFYSRNLKNLTAQFPEFDFRKSIVAKSCILDGEIVAYDKKGHPSFALLQQRGMKKDILIVYIVFDILKKNGKSLFNKPLLERKDILDNTIQNHHEHLEKILFTDNGKKLMKEMLKRKLEGVVAKKEESHYYPGKRTKNWLKIKFLQTYDCVIVGYTQEKRVVSSLALGLYDKNKKLHYVGKVGTGFTERLVHELYSKLQKLQTEKSPVVNPVDKTIMWAKPKLVGEIAFLEMTKTHRLRAPSFKRLRVDKKPQECTFEQ